MLFYRLFFLKSLICEKHGDTWWHGDKFAPCHYPVTMFANTWWQNNSIYINVVTIVTIVTIIKRIYESKWCSGGDSNYVKQRNSDSALVKLYRKYGNRVWHRWHRDIVDFIDVILSPCHHVVFTTPTCAFARFFGTPEVSFGLNISFRSFAVCCGISGCLLYTSDAADE